MFDLIPITKIVIHCLPVSLMDGITVKNDCFCFGPPGTLATTPECPWTPLERHCAIGPRFQPVIDQKGFSPKY